MQRAIKTINLVCLAPDNTQESIICLLQQLSHSLSLKDPKSWLEVKTKDPNSLIILVLPEYNVMVDKIVKAILGTLNSPYLVIFYTYIKLAQKLEYCFKRDSVKIYGNVVKASHGDTRKEGLGSGDGAKALQSFQLKQPPLTNISASNPSGVDSTLKVYVNDLQWRETDSLAGLSPADRDFITKTSDEDKITVTFGNGREGA